MGMWTGISQGFDAAEAKKTEDRKIKLAEEQFAEGKRQTRLEMLLKYGEDSKESTKTAKTKASEIKRLTLIGLPKEVALFLSASGEGAELLKQYDKVAVDKRSKDWLKSLTKKVENYLGDEANAENFAKAFKASVLSGEDLSDPAGQEASLIQSIYAATTTEDFKNLDEQLIEVLTSTKGTDTAVSVDPVGIRYSGMVALPAARLKQIEAEIVKRVSPSFGGFFQGTDPEGNPILNPEITEVGGLGAVEFRNYIDQGLQSVKKGLQSADSSLSEQELIQNAADAIKTYSNTVTPPGTDVIKTEEGSLNSIPPLTNTAPINSPAPINESFQERLDRINQERLDRTKAGR